MRLLDIMLDSYTALAVECVNNRYPAEQSFIGFKRTISSKNSDKPEYEISIQVKKL